eukprot:11731082-Alexandrium_andersonii.AAC.1
MRHLTASAEAMPRGCHLMNEELARKYRSTIGYVPGAMTCPKTTQPAVACRPAGTSLYPGMRRRLTYNVAAVSVS